MEERLVNELKYYSEILETHFHDMVDIEFTIEKGKLYILSVHSGRRTELANLKIVISMFCEGKMSVRDVFLKLHYQKIINILDTKTVTNAQELELIGKGVSASGGVATATVCHTISEADNFIRKKENFILAQIELPVEAISIVSSKYCQGVITARGGMTSHAAVVCRGIGKPCIFGFGELDKLVNLANLHDKEITIDANNGFVYIGIGKISKNTTLAEIEILRELLSLVIKYNIITAEICPLIWRLWDVIVLKKRYEKNNVKRLVTKKDNGYISFEQTTEKEIDAIYSKLKDVPNCNLLIEDMISFLFDEISSQVPLGEHYLYMRPVLNPIDTMKYAEKSVDYKCAGTQLTGIEFFHINKFVDFLLDIYSIKIYFSTPFYKRESTDGTENTFAPLNYLDYTNPCGESLIINTYDAKKIAVYINDIQISSEEISIVYYLLRRRKYYWTWYKENNISKNEIVNYLKTDKFLGDKKTKLYFLCEEMHLICDDKLTLAGKSLLEDKKMNANKSINDILDEVILRGSNDNSSDSNDFSKLIQKKDFKDLIALEIYEYYFWSERHEYDLQIIKEIVESVATYFSNPEVIGQIEAGVLQTFPSTIILSILAAIWAKMKKIMEQKHSLDEENASWSRIKNNIKKIDKEFENHDYVLTEEIESIFSASREEIQPLLKLCGCKCYVHKNMSLWIKPGVKEERIRDILKIHHFKYK